MQAAGKIKDLRYQVKFQITPPQEAEGEKMKGASYIADFVYTDCDTGEQVVEDAKSKGTRTDVFVLKKKALLHFYGIYVREV